ncbi:hypothetical protein ElyMa_002417500 [Elysia marginata]|uniref:Reverse transcriptase zinc-binding domain-containing protein n=1 Tax=Elysia marginata TaxID=1093978 RepID=A0AAV4GGK7_9GAST|nr:hypothetical protein ElyMa_002417500 [Elysia marginata]
MNAFHVVLEQTESPTGPKNCRPCMRKSQKQETMWKKSQVLTTTYVSRPKLPDSEERATRQIGDGPNCPCGANRQDAQHVLQDCPLLDDARLKYLPEPREMNQKLYGSALQLGITAEFMYASDLTI